MNTPRRAALFLSTIACTLALGTGLTSAAPLTSGRYLAPAAAAVTNPPTVSAPATLSPIASPTRIATVVPVAIPTAKPVITAKPAPKIVSKSAPKPAVAVKRSPVASSPYRGKNHLWFPALGINRSIDSRVCTGSPLANGGISRWCAEGPGNTYLMAHAWGAFHPLEVAYWGRRLRVGQSVWYADANGRVRHYEVAFWKVESRSASDSWAWASSASPELTLQTCVDANNHVLFVRLKLVP